MTEVRGRGCEGGLLLFWGGHHGFTAGHMLHYMISAFLGHRPGQSVRQEPSASYRLDRRNVAL